MAHDGRVINARARADVYDDKEARDVKPAGLVSL